MSFQQEYDATISAPEELYLPKQSAVSSSSQHSAARNVSTLSKLGSVGTSSRKLVADYGAVVSRTCIKETCADMDRETAVPKGKTEIEIKTLCNHWEIGNVSTYSLNEQLNSPWLEKNWLSKDYTKLEHKWKSFFCSLRDQSGVLVPTFTATTCESMGGLGSKRQNRLVWRIGNEEETLLRISKQNWRIVKNLLRGNW